LFLSLEHTGVRILVEDILRFAAAADMLPVFFGMMSNKVVGLILLVTAYQQSLRILNLCFRKESR
jgi:hypothetical protein